MKLNVIEQPWTRLIQLISQVGQYDGALCLFRRAKDYRFQYRNMLQVYLCNFFCYKVAIQGPCLNIE